MKFGIFFELSTPRPFSTAVEWSVYHNALEQCRLADELGFDHVWAVEHHFLEEYSHCSSPEVFLTAVAARRNASASATARWCACGDDQPIAAGERGGALIISGQPAGVGTAQSSTWTELGGFSGDTKTWDEFVRAQMWTKDEFSGRAKLIPSRNVLPKPYQQPHRADVGDSDHARHRVVQTGSGLSGVRCGYEERERRTKGITGASNSASPLAA